VRDQNDFGKPETLGNFYLNVLRGNKCGDVLPLIEEFDTLYNQVERDVEIAKSNGELQSNGAILLDEIQTSQKTIINKTKSKLGVAYDSSLYTELGVSKTNEMFTIKYAFENGFVDMPSKSATLFSLFLSLIVDLAALLYILFFVKYGKSNKGRLSRGPDVIN
jgi:hypothetical protein